MMGSVLKRIRRFIGLLQDQIKRFFPARQVLEKVIRGSIEGFRALFRVADSVTIQRNLEPRPFSSFSRQTKAQQPEGEMDDPVDVQESL
jgi:hypothetical protein